MYYDDGSAIYAVPVAGGTPQQVLSGYTEPKDSPDGSALLVRIGDGDYGVQIRETGEVRRLGAFRWIKWLAVDQLIGYGTFTVGGQPGVYRIDNIAGAAPQLIYTPASGLRAVDAALLTADTARVLLTGQSENAPAPVISVEMSLDGMGTGELRNLGYLTQPQLSADGQFASGYTSGDGSMAIHQIDTDTEVALRLPASIRQFEWSLFR